MSALSRCRCCGSGALEDVLDLGPMPLANALVEPDAPANEERRHPLGLVLCTQCSQLQITHTVAPEEMFRSYPYFSSVSDAMVAHARNLVDTVLAQVQLGPGSLAAEIASNDGYLLQHYVARGIDVLGIDPARNVAQVAQDKGVPTVAEFFGHKLAAGLGRQADVLHANNVMAHVPDVHDVVAGIKTFLAPGGVFVTESPYVRRMVEGLAFDTVYHEHVFYHSLSAQVALYAAHALTVVDVTHVAVHGGSLRLFVKHAGAPAHPRVAQLLDQEQAWGVHEAGTYRAPAARFRAACDALVSKVHALTAAGGAVAAYGAAAKGTILLNTAGLGADQVVFVADRSPHKQGRLMPGVRIPICAPQRLLADMPAHTLLLPWNLADEVMAQQQTYRSRGGRFIIPLPEVRVL